MIELIQLTGRAKKPITINPKHIVMFSPLLLNPDDPDQGHHGCFIETTRGHVSVIESYSSVKQLIQDWQAHNPLSVIVEGDIGVKELGDTIYVHTGR